MTTNRTTRHEPDAWTQAIRTRVYREAASNAGVVHGRHVVARRSFLRGTFLGGIGLSALGGLSGLVDYLWPRNVRGFGGPVPSGTLDEIPLPGAPPMEFVEGQFWLVNLDPADIEGNGSGGGSGLLALWKKCPHLGCSVPWTEQGKPPPQFAERNADAARCSEPGGCRSRR